jgi:hypothetical protein
MRYIIILLVLLLASCSERTGNPVTPDSVNDNVIASKNTIDLFPDSYKNIDISLNSAVPDNIQPSIKDRDYGYFTVNNARVIHDSTDKIIISLTGKQIMLNAETFIVSINIGEQKYKFQFKVFVHDFYYGEKLETNTPNDTIYISKDGNFLLKITCKDTSGKTTPKVQINSLGLGYSYGILQNYNDLKIAMATVDKDDTSYYFMFSALPDIIPDELDKGIYFSFGISNKSLTLPIKIIY